MSYTIEYNRKIFKTAEMQSGCDSDMLLLVRQGDNNCRVAKTGQRVKDWRLVAVGWNYSIVGEVCRRAGSCEGGGLQRAKGYESQHITPEDYIALHRKAIKNAKSIELLFEQFDVEAYFELSCTDKDGTIAIVGSLDDYYASKVIEYANTHKLPLDVGKDWYQNPSISFRRSIANYKEMQEAMFLRGLQSKKGVYLFSGFRFTPKK